jgi:hypothetical protein
MVSYDTSAMNMSTPVGLFALTGVKPRASS